VTRRGRLERKTEKREEWAAKARARSEASFAAASAIADRIPLGQPILVGHHSERRARRDQARIHGSMDKGVEEHKLAEHHDQKRRGLEIQLDRTIFDDDPDAVEQLEARIAEREKSAAYQNTLNKAWRSGYKKGGVEGAIAALVAAGASEALARETARTVALCSWLERGPFSATGDRAAVRADKERIRAILAKRERASLAEQAPGGVLIQGAEYVRVTFPEKPARETLNALRAAGFRWGSGSWHGRRDALPNLTEAPTPAFAEVSSP